MSKKLPAGIISPILLVVIGLIFGIAATVAYSQFKPIPGFEKSAIPVAQQQTPTPATTPSPDETANWKTYETNKFSIKYPPNWVLTNSIYPTPRNDESTVTFYSSDYEDDGGFPSVTKGFKVLLTVADKGLGYRLTDLNTVGVVGITETTWLGKKAQLVKIAYEGAIVRLETVATLKDLNLVMFTPVIEKPAFKTFEDNKKDFLTVANSLKLK